MLFKIIITIFLLATILICLSSSKMSESYNFEGPFDFGVVDDKLIDEASGLAASRNNNNVLWVHNDDSTEAKVYAINTSGKIVAIHVLNIKQGRDWEDIAIGPGPEAGVDYIYFGDIGDNLSQYEKKDIYRFKEPAVKENQTLMIDTIKVFDKISFKLPDKTYDSEALMIDPLTKDLYVITKRLKNDKVYRLAYPQSLSKTITAEYICDLPFGYEGFNGSGVTAADISADGQEILIKTYSKIYYFKRNSGQSIKDAIKQVPVQVKYQMEPQGEGLAWHPEGFGYYTISESALFSIPAHLYYYKRIESSVKKKMKPKKKSK